MNGNRLMTLHVAGVLMIGLWGCSAADSQPRPAGKSPSPIAEVETRAVSQPASAAIDETLQVHDEFGESMIQDVVERFSDGSVCRRFQAITDDQGQQIHHGSFVEFYWDGAKFTEGNFVRGQRHGTWSYWHRNGIIARTAEYVDGAARGRWFWYRTDGTLSRESTYARGQRNGATVVYAEDGQTAVRSESYRDDKLHGPLVRWHENGIKSNEVQFENGVPHGEEVRWHENGQMSAVGHYRNGRPHGEFKYWATDGSPIKTVKWSDGQRTLKPLETTGE